MLSSVLNDVRALISEVVGRLGAQPVYNSLGRDKNTVKRWIEGTAQPSEPKDVAAILHLALKNGIDVSPYQAFSPIYDFSPHLTYEQKIAAGPPELGWLNLPHDPLPQVEVQVCGLSVASPIGIASSPLMGDDKWALTMLGLGFEGISTFKTRRATPRESSGPPQVAFVLRTPQLLNYDPDNPPEVLVTYDRSQVRRQIPDIVNSIGVPSESPLEWQAMYLNVKRHPRGRNVGVSVIADASAEHGLEKDLEEVMARAMEVDPPFVELNVSCPNLKTKDLYRQITTFTGVCRKASDMAKNRTRLILKLPYLPEAQLHALLKPVALFVQGVVFHNTLRIRPVVQEDGETHPAFPGREFAGLSGPCTYHLTLRGVESLVKIKSALKQEFSIIAVGGVSTPKEVWDLLAAGADAVQACTTPMFDPLLAWKVRLLQPVSSLQASLIAPRDEAEFRSMSNATQAVTKLNEMYPHRKMPAEVFGKKWNEWMSARPVAYPGRAQRVAGPRTVTEWMAELTK